MTVLGWERGIFLAPRPTHARKPRPALVPSPAAGAVALPRPFDSAIRATQRTDFTLGAPGYAHLPRTEGHAAGPPGVPGRAPHPLESDTDVPGQELAEFAGRLCYLSFGPDAGFEGGHRLISGRTSNREYLDNILAVRHGSVLEHAVWSLLIEGVSRALTHELVRHRHFSYSQLSQRYVDESEVGFVLPPEIEEGTPGVRDLEAELRARRSRSTARSSPRSRSRSRTSPTATLRRKRARQTARSVLPNAAETKIVVTGNARAWRHFLEMRGSRRPRPRSASSPSRSSRCSRPRRPTSSATTASSSCRTGSA